MSKEASASVAIILAAVPQETILLLRRNQRQDDPWSGHFSFPGGRRDRTDASLLHTCLRETYEETGIQLSAADLCSTLPVTLVGNRLHNPLLVQPYLFCVAEQPLVMVDPQEIAGSCWLEVAQFRQQYLHTEAEALPAMMFPAFPLEDYYVWGFTYRMLWQVVSARPSR